MDIVIKDSHSGKELLIRGREREYEIFKRSKGLNAKGRKNRKGEWISAQLFPTSLSYAVEKCVTMLLANPDDDDPVVVEAEKASYAVRRAVKKRAEEIYFEILQEAGDA